MEEHPYKNLNPLKIFLIGLVALICLGAIAIFIDQSRIRERDRAEAPRKSKDQSIANLQAEDVLSKIRSRISSKDLEIAAEEKLEKQTLPGKAALAAIDLNEAKSSLAKHDDLLKRSFEKLRDIQKEYGLENPALGKKLLEIEEKLRSFDQYASRVLYEHQSANKYKGILSPDTKALFDESLRIRSIKLSEVLQGGYEAEIVLRVEADRQKRFESNMKEFQSMKQAAE